MAGEADVNTTVASSPTEQANPLEGLTPEQRHSWQMTGTLPSTADSASAPSSEGSALTEKAPEKAVSAATPEGEAAADSEPAKPQETKGKGAEARKLELNTEIRELIRKRDEAKKELEGVKLPASPAVEPVQATGPDEGPQEEDFDDHLKYVDARITWGVQQGLKAEREAQEKATKQAQVEADKRVFLDGLQKRLREGQKKHPDFSKVVLDDTLPIFEKSVVENRVLAWEETETKVAGTEVWYYLATHREELDRINALPDPFAQHEALIEVRDSLSEKVPVKKVSSALPPAKEVGGRASAAKDEVRAAGERGDFRAFMDAANAEEISSRKG